MIKKKNAYLQPNHEHCFRSDSDENPLVTGVVVASIGEGRERLCYEVKYEDGFKDYVPFESVKIGNYVLTDQNCRQ